MAQLLPTIKARFTTVNGDPLAGGKVYSYEAGSNTPRDTYIDANETAVNPNPVILDAAGEADIWLKEGQAYKIVVTTADDVTRITTDDIIVSSTGGNSSLGTVFISGLDPVAGFLGDKLVAGANITLDVITNAGGDTLSVAAVLDGKVLASALDVTADYLQAKIEAGSGIIVDTSDPTKLVISSEVTDRIVQVSGTDTTPGFLAEKIQGGTGITLSITNSPGDEKLVITNDAPNSDELVKVSAIDPTPGYLLNKLVAGGDSSLTFTDETSFLDLKVDLLGIADTQLLLKDGNVIGPATNVYLTAGTLSAPKLGTTLNSDIDTALDAKADDSLVVHTAGEETITGVKTFQDRLLLEDEDASNTILGNLQNINGQVTLSRNCVYEDRGAGENWYRIDDSQDASRIAIGSLTNMVVAFAPAGTGIITWENQFRVLPASNVIEAFQKLEVEGGALLTEGGANNSNWTPTDVDPAKKLWSALFNRDTASPAYTHGIGSYVDLSGNSHTLYWSRFDHVFMSANQENFRILEDGRLKKLNNDSSFRYEFGERSVAPSGEGENLGSTYTDTGVQYIHDGSEFVSTETRLNNFINQNTLDDTYFVDNEAKTLNQIGTSPYPRKTNVNVANDGKTLLAASNGYTVDPGPAVSYDNGKTFTLLWSESANSFCWNLKQNPVTGRYFFTARRNDTAVVRWSDTLSTNVADWTLITIAGTEKAPRALDFLDDGRVVVGLGDTNASIVISTDSTGTAFGSVISLGSTSNRIVNFLRDTETNTLYACLGTNTGQIYSADASTDLATDKWSLEVAPSGIEVVNPLMKADNGDFYFTTGSSVAADGDLWIVRKGNAFSTAVKQGLNTTVMPLLSTWGPVIVCSEKTNLYLSYDGFLTYEVIDIPDQTNNDMLLFNNEGKLIYATNDGVVDANTKSWEMNIGVGKITEEETYLPNIRFPLQNRVVVTQENYANVLTAIVPTKEYFLDGIIDVGNLTITIPVGGINITGYNFDASKLITSQASHTLFNSGSGGSGNVLFKDFAIEVTGTGSQVYDIKSVTGNEAYEIARINFNNCTSLGTIDNYRQGFEQGTGRFGGKPELTLKGVWSGGYFIESSIVRALTDGAYTLYKAGVGFTMASRFRSNQNIDLNATVSFFDFAPANFLNPNTVQLDSCIVTRNGVIDATDATIIPNMSHTDLETYWKGNTGIRNTYVGGRNTITAEQATVVAVGSTFYDLNGTYTASALQHFSEQSNGVLEHDGVNPIEFQVVADLNLESTSGNVLEARWAKWNSATSTWFYFGNQKRQVNALVGGRDMAFFTMVNNIVLNQGDYLKMQVANNNGPNNITAELDSFFIVQER